MIKQLLGDYNPMMNSICHALDALGIDITVCDHLCYWVETVERYDELISILTRFGENIGENTVGGRAITIFRLHNALVYGDLRISCLELPAPKQTSFYPEGWEHAEFVTPKLDEFIEEHKHIEFNAKAMDRTLNPELALKISDKYQVKFHPMHIIDVLKAEAQQI